MLFFLYKLSFCNFLFFCFFKELKRVTSLKQQLETYKKQTVELQNKTVEETKRADKAEFEFKRMQEKTATLQREKEVKRNDTSNFMYSI